MTKVFLSSTSKDLSLHRDAVYKAIEGLDDFHCIRMEDFGARDKSVKEICQQKISGCELFVCLVGLCYGSLAPNFDASYTVLEYRSAEELGVSRLVFMSSNEDHYPGVYREPDELWSKQQTFRQEVSSECIRETFIEPSDLARKVVVAIHNWRQGSQKLVIIQPNYFEQRATRPGAHTQSFDHIPCLHASLADLELQKIGEFLKKDLVQRQEDFLSSGNMQIQLNHLGLLYESHPTYGCLLCFGQRPQTRLAGATTRCVYWRDNTRRNGWLDDYTCSGDLISQFESALSFLRKNLRFSRIIGEEGRIEQYEIPLVALSEALANALVHREYAIWNGNEYVERTDRVQIEIFDNRIEIKSPGPLPSPMTLELLRVEDTSHPRNPLIARVFYLHGFVEYVGSGIQRMQDAMDDLDLPPPRFEMNDAQTFKVILERPKQIPNEILKSAEFGGLLTQGLNAIGQRESIDIKQAIEKIRNSMEEIESFQIQKWLRGYVPTSQYQVVELARICVQLGKMDQNWIYAFLNAGRIPIRESFITELFPPKEDTQYYPNDLEKFPLIWHVPYPRNPVFTGREPLLVKLVEALHTNNAAALTQPQALSGLGGIGKTQTALEYAYRFQSNYQAVLWVQADTYENLTSSYLTLAALLNLSEKDEQESAIVIAAVKNWLQQTSNWLLILDNADELTLLLDFLPPRMGGKVILTTRAQTPGRFAHRVEVDTFSTERGALFLLRRIGLLAPDAPLEHASEEEQHGARTICELLGGLPLALDQAGAYIEETGCSLVEYEQLFSHHSADLLAERRGSLVNDHPDSVATTWSLSFERVKQKSPAAADLLRLCAFLAPDTIPETIIMQGAEYLGEHLASVGEDRYLLNQAIEVLRTYSLLTREIHPAASSLSVHRLVQAVLKDQMNEQEKHQWAERTIRAVEAALPAVDHQRWAQWEQILPQALQCKKLIEQDPLLSAEASRLLRQTGWYLTERTRYGEAEPLLKQALIISEQEQGLDHLDTAQASLTLAYLHKAQGKYAEAEPLLVRALAINEQQLGPQHPDTASSLNNLAALYDTQGKHAEAEPLLVRALAINEQQLGPQHPDTASSLNNLAALYDTQGKYAEAEPLLVRALAINEQQLGPQHPNTASSLNNLAALYATQGKYAEAEPLLVRALAIREQQLGPQHPNTASSLNNLAYLYDTQGKYTEAEPLLVRALAINEQQLGPQHPNTASSLNNLALLYATQEKYTEAEPLYVRALAIREQQLGPQHPDTAQSLNNLAYLYDTQGKYTEAEPLYVRALAINEQQLGPQHPSTQTVRANYAFLLEAMGRNEEAH